MYDHKKVRQKRNVKQRRIVKSFLMVCIIMGMVWMFINYQNWRKEIRARQEWLESVLTEEKKWILKNQGAAGEIYMNGEKAGDVNPYFACMAALGLLAETKNCPMSETEKNAVSRYLNWHTKMLLETDGKMGIYRKEGQELVYVGKADSEDGYLGMYLLLIGEYLKKTGDTESLESWQEGIHLALNKIQSLMRDGTTQVSTENTTIYLMDNLEVWKGLLALEAADIMQDDMTQTQVVTEMRENLQKQIEAVFWNEKNQRWRIMRDSDHYNPEKFYPDGIAQVYPLICGFKVKEKKAQKELYNQFTEKFQWQEMNKTRKGFAWTITGMAAVQVRDNKHLIELIKNYETEFHKNRKYPLYTGEAGWICREIGDGVFWH